MTRASWSSDARTNVLGEACANVSRPDEDDVPEYMADVLHDALSAACFADAKAMRIRVAHACVRSLKIDFLWKIFFRATFL